MKFQDLFEKNIKHKLEYHTSLNHKLWDSDLKLFMEPKLKLKEIAKKFIKYLEISNEHIADIILTGSNCNYNWSKLSDIDLHVVIDYESMCDECKKIDLADCLDAKKKIWNEKYSISIYDHDVELYAQDVSEKITGDAGVYSLMNDKWIRKPKNKDIKYATQDINKKAQIIANDIDELMSSETATPQDFEKIKTKIKKLRTVGLQKNGEFSIENLVFKALRNNGYFDKMNDHLAKLESQLLSLD